MDVIIAPARVLGANRQTSINEIDHLPLGDRTSVIRQKLNDDTLTNDSIAPHIADAKERNKNYTPQEVRLIRPSEPVGKKAYETRPLIHDQSVMREFNKKNGDRTTAHYVRHEKTKNCNLVAMPFVTAEPMKFPDGNSGCGCEDNGCS